jgi:predicted acylesterase/phospholipase RssA
MTPLKRLLESLIDFDQLGKRGPRLLVAVTNVEQGEVQLFDSSRDVITPDHLLASGALPPAFPSTRIGSFHYWDGGLVDSRPLGPIMERLSTEPGVEKRIVAVELRQERGWVPQNLLEVYDRIFELIFLERFGFDHRQTEKRNELAALYQALENELPAESPLRRLPGFKRLAKYRMIQRLDFIRNRDAAVVRGPFYFSPKAVTRRIQAGYDDADFYLANNDHTVSDDSTDQSLESSCSSRPSPKS